MKSKSGDDGEDDEEDEEEPSADEPAASPQVPSSGSTKPEVKATAAVEPKPAPEVHALKPSLPPTASAATAAPAAVPETAESQEDLRRLRLHHRRQQVAAPPTAAEPEMAPVETEAPATRSTRTRSARMSVAPTAPPAATSSPEQPPATAAPNPTKDRKDGKDKPSLIAPPPSRLTRQSSRQDDSSPSVAAAAPPAAPQPVAVEPAVVPPPRAVPRPQTAPPPPIATTASHPTTRPPASSSSQSVAAFELAAPEPSSRQAVSFPSAATQAATTTDDEGHHNERNVTDYTSSTLRVVVRKRPLGQHEVHRGERDIIDIGEMGALVVRDIKVKVDLTKVWQTIPFQFDDAFADYDSNRTIYDNCLRSLVPNVLSEGMKVSCFTYGQTGSGKTYTMFGAGEHAASVADEGDRFGLYHLCMADVLHMIEQSSVLSTSIRVYLTCFEIYGEKLFDLLNNRTVVKNLEDAKQHVRIVGLTEHEVTSLETFQRLLQTIVASRSTSSTGANHDSSRSHQVLEVSFKYYNPALAAQQHQHGSISRRPKSAPAPTQLPAAVMGKIVFVDLAGSEKAADTFMNAKSTRMEGADINTSLLALKEVFRSMEKKNGYMPFRGSKLTQVLKESLQGKSVRTCMIACVSPASSHYEQTMNTLRYAAKVYEVTAGSGAGGGNDAEESPLVAEDPRIVYTAADFQEMQAAADVLAQHGQRHATATSSGRAVSAPRGGGARSRSGSQSAASGGGSAAASSSSSAAANRRISSGATGSATGLRAGGAAPNAGPSSVAEAARLPLSRFLSSEDEYGGPSSEAGAARHASKRLVPSSQHVEVGSDRDVAHYTAEDEHEAAPTASDRRRSAAATATGGAKPRVPTAAATHVGVSTASQSAVQSSSSGATSAASGERPSLIRRNSFAGHKAPSSTSTSGGPIAVPTAAASTGASSIPTSPGRALKRATSAQLTNGAHEAGAAALSGLPRPQRIGSSATAAPATGSTATHKTNGASLASPSRRTLPDYPESSDAYEEDEPVGPVARSLASQAATRPSATAASKHPQHYQLEPVEATYYASNAHLTAESYRAASSPEAEDDGDDFDEDDADTDERGERRLGAVEDVVVDEGEAGDDEHDRDDSYGVDDEEDEEAELHVVSADGARSSQAAGESTSAGRTEEMQMTWGLLSAHKLSIAEMVEVMKEEMELVQRMESVDERDTDGYLDTLQAILTAKSLAVQSLRGELRAFQQFRTEQRLYR